MKKIWLFVLILFLIISISPTAFASDAENSLNNAIDEQLGVLDTDDFDKFLKGLDNDYVGDRLKNYINQIVNGESVFDVIEFVNLACGGLLDGLLSSIPMCASIILICVLSSTLTRFSSKFAQNSTQKIIRFVTVCVVLVIMVSATLNYSNEVLDTVKTLRNFTNVIFPVLVTLLTVVGGTRVVGVFSPFVAIFSTLILNGIEGIIFPIFFACLALSVVGNVTDSVKLDRLRGFLSSTGKWILGLVFGLFTTFLSGQALVSSAIDGVSIKATKFALSSYVPILGGYLSDGFDFVMAGSVLIKNAVGLTGIVVLAVIISIPLLKLVVFSLILKLTSGITESLGDSNIAKMIGSVSSSLNILSAVLLGVGFVFFFILLLLIFTVNVGVI